MYELSSQINAPTTWPLDWLRRNWRRLIAMWSRATCWSRPRSPGGLPVGVSIVGQPAGEEL
jgi:hypothetical protein